MTGKWQWARDLNAFVGLQHTYFGNVWIYKPGNWTAPAASASSMRTIQVNAQRQPATYR